MLNRTNSIDIFVSVVDNLGDMGFALELVASYQSQYPDSFSFRIFTDAKMVVEKFFSLNNTILGNYRVYDMKEFEPEKLSDCIFLLFHFPVPDFFDMRKRLVLRVDYFSLDPSWISQNGSEHIQSNNCTEIREIIPSILPESSGIIQHSFPSLDRKEWLKVHGFSEYLAKKKWIFMFIYGLTNDRIDWDSFDDAIIFSCSVLSPERENIIKLPLLPMIDFYTLMKLSDFLFIRGEVSFVQAIQMNTPFLWDMYKERGGFYLEQNNQFLEYGKFNEEYSRLHQIVNGQHEGRITLADIEFITKTFPDTFLQKKKSGYKNLAQELKRYIDDFYMKNGL